jgi:hypothetical protein
MTGFEQLDMAPGQDLARTLEHLTRALLDPATGQVERPRVAVVPAAPDEPPDDTAVPEPEPAEPVVLRPRRGVDLLAELAFLDR